MDMQPKRTPEQIIGKDAVMQLIFEGYVVAPQEPTEAMIKAGTQSVMSFGRASNAVCNAYRKMIDAALSSPKHNGGEE